MVSKGFFITAPVITSIVEYLEIFFILGLSPAARIFIILNFIDFLLSILFVSLELIAKPSNAVLLAAG